jgi:putative nucleotidyltransferase with HDIG domain
MGTAAELVTQVDKLISFPDVAIQVNDLLADEHSGADEIGSIIEQDPALTATLLKLANSSMYGVGAEVDTVAKAFMRVGSNEIQQLTFGICASSAFDGISNEIISVQDFWRHSLLCGTAAKLIAKRIRSREASMMFTAGLLHDIGHLVMFHLIPEESMQALALSRDEMDGEDIYLAEREVLGFDHAEVGRCLGEQWNWPVPLINSIARHHEPFKYSDLSDVDVVVHLANSVAGMMEVESVDMSDGAPVDERVWEHLKLEPEAIPELLDDIREGMSGLLRLFAH